MADWIDELAAALEQDGLAADERVRLLGVARDVAHRVERRSTPLAAFLLGSAVERARAGGTGRPEAFATALERLEGILPEGPAPESPTEA
jgi:hypothetical protein